MAKVAIVHTALVLDEGGMDETRVSVGQVFPAKDSVDDAENFMEAIMLSDGDSVIVDFGVGQSVYSKEPDASGLSYASWFELKEV